MLIQPKKWIGAEQHFLTYSNNKKADWFSPLLDPCAGEGSNVENLPDVEDDRGFEDDSHGVIVNQRRTPYLAC
jgi:hypothetical protein